MQLTANTISAWVQSPVLLQDSKGKMGLFTAKKQENIPVRLPLDIQMIKIASGSNHLVCLSADGDIYTCGKFLLFSLLL